ncbi:hypothetical protein FRB90_011519 [Tulasnella sp. 427]|nr:hypothetical protein FRB90_011519 [Tulasnella sp. 427]
MDSSSAYLDSSRTPAAMHSLSIAAPLSSHRQQVDGLSASNSTVSSPPDPRTPPILAQDLYGAATQSSSSSYNDSFVSLSSESTSTTTGPSTHYAHLQQPSHVYGTLHPVGGPADTSVLGGAGAGAAGPSRLHPPSPGYPLHRIPSLPHSLTSSAANTPPKDFLPQLAPIPIPNASASDYGYGLPPSQVAQPIDMVRHGSFSSVASSSAGYEYGGPLDDGPPGLEKAPPEVTGSYAHPWSSSSGDAYHPSHPPQHPPVLPHHSTGVPAPHHQHQHQPPPPVQPPQFPPSRRGSFLEDLYTPSHSPSSHEFPPIASAHHHHHQPQHQIPPLAHHAHHEQQDISPHSRPLSDLTPSGQQQQPLPRISTQFDDHAWPPTTVSPELTQHQHTSEVSPTTTLNGPYATSSVNGGEYNQPASVPGPASGSVTPQQGVFHHQPPSFARRYSSPAVGVASRAYESSGVTIGGPAPGLGGSPPSFPSLGQPDASHMASASFGAGNFAFRPPPLYEEGQDMSDRFESVANGPSASHTMTRHPSLPTLSSMYHGQHHLSHQHVPFVSPNAGDSPPSLADSRLAHRSNSLPSSALLLNPLQLGGGQPSTHSPPQLQPAHSLFPHQHHRALSLSKQPQMGAPVGPIVHTDDAASKETANLRRKCHNCQTTEPPSWRRSTLAPGKIVCNRCGLYERTHLRPRPCGTGGELRKASISMTAAAGGSIGRVPSGSYGGPLPTPYSTSPVNSKTGAPVRTSKKAAAAMAAMGVHHHPLPSLQHQQLSHQPAPPQRSLSQSFAAAADWEESKNAMVSPHHHQQHFGMPPMAGVVPEMSLRPLAHAHSMQ